MINVQMKKKLAGLSVTLEKIKTRGQQKYTVVSMGREGFKDGLGKASHPQETCINWKR
jgi:hypothetical protein